MQTCGECRVNLRLESLLRRHLRRFTTDADSRAAESHYGAHAHGREFLRCPRCRWAFSSAWRLATHARLCRKEFCAES
jgi:hypothetical protein